ncbi:hypothetical protein LT493_21955 [Streptomyces tricolor]|nr:hypothetical protein [Streptomyces tricolor]
MTALKGEVPEAAVLELHGSGDGDGDARPSPGPPPRWPSSKPGSPTRVRGHAARWWSPGARCPRAAPPR